MQFATAREQKYKLGFEFFGDLPEQRQGRMLTPRFDVDDRYPADSKSLCQFSLADLGLQSFPRCADLMPNCPV